MPQPLWQSRTFSYGKFSAADAMYAPVVTRFHTYGVICEEPIAAYIKTILALPAMQEWYQAAAAEPWIIEATEAA